MKKIFYGILVAMFALVLVACKPGEKDEKVTLRYAAWNLGTPAENNLERRMIQAFKAENPGVEIEVIERPKVIDENGNEVEETWDNFFNAQAAIGRMPDVFQVSSVVNAINNQWVEDVTEYTLADEDFKKMPEDIRNSATYNGKVLALPQSMFYMGYFINRTVIEDNYKGVNPVLPTYGTDIEDLLDIAEKTASNAITGGDGIVGINGMDSLYNWMSAQQNDDFGWFTYTEGEGYHLNSDEFISAINYQRKFFGNDANEYKDYVLDSLNAVYQLTQDEKDSPNFRYGDGNYFEAGKQAIIWEPSYNLRDWLGASQTLNEKLPGLYGQDIDFIATPSVTIDGKKQHKIPIILDYIGVGKGTKHGELAYEFAKWMGFGKEGYLKRLEIAEKYPSAGAVNFAPLIQDQELTDAYFQLYPTLTEFKKVVTEHQDFIIESLGKTVPGYVNSRWEGIYDDGRTIGVVIDQIRDGKLSINDVANELNEQANKYYREAKELFDRNLATYY